MACQDRASDIAKYDMPLSVIVTPKDHNLYEALPNELRVILESLTFTDPELNKKIIGGAPEQKIKTYDVKAYVAYEDGWLVASGYGEWGGVVFWIGKDGSYEIIRDDDLAYPIDAVVNDNIVFITQGMAHLSISDGHLLEVSRNNNEFGTKTYPFKFYPSSFEKHNGDWIIPLASHQSYYVLSELRAGENILHKRD
jgi:hypothetical protein